MIYCNNSVQNTGQKSIKRDGEAQHTSASCASSGVAGHLA
jgi:hypothetical protein